MSGKIHGHIYHPYEDRGLSFFDLKKMINDLSSGAIELHEKADGINLYITWDFENNILRVARNKTHVKNGGIDRAGLEKKFEGRGILKDAFVEAYDVLNRAFSTMAKQTLSAIFGMTSGIWFSIDIIYPAARNLIQYDEKHVVFHKTGVVLFDWDGNQMECRTDRHFKMLEKVIPHLNEAISHTGWTLHGPKLVQFPNLDSNYINKQFSKIESILKQYRLRESDTIQDYIKRRLKNDVSSIMFVPDYMRDDVINRAVGIEGAPTPNSLCKDQLPAIQDHIKTILRVSPEFIRTIMAPIEDIVHSISCTFLGGCKSAFVRDGEAEVQRLRSEIGRAINALESSGDQAASEIVRRHMSKLHSANKINTSIEGVVFPYKQKIYKLTGNFAPANQIYGYVKYKLNPVHETAKDEVLANYILSMVAG